MDEHVWVAPADVPGAAAWMAGGTYLVARRIRMHIEVWDRTNLQDQEDDHRADKEDGAPLGQEQEFDEPDFAKKGTDGEPAIAVDAHIRLAHKSQPRRRADPAPRLQLHRRHRRRGPPRRRSVLHRLRPRPRASSSSRCSGRWRARTSSTSTSSTTARPSSPARPGSREGGYWGDALFA